jgi:hypothetical protein
MNETTDRAKLAGVSVPLGHGRVKTLAELVDGWVQHVDRLHREQRATARDPYAWGAHDYLAALHLRTMVASAVGHHGTAIREAADRLLAATDEEFMSFTEPDPVHVVESFAGQRCNDSEWWWHRIPSSGPVRSELLRVVDGA